MIDTSDWVSNDVQKPKAGTILINLITETNKSMPHMSRKISTRHTVRVFVKFIYDEWVNSISKQDCPLSVFVESLKFFGHIARKEGHKLEQLIVTGKFDGKRPRSRSPIRWSDQIHWTLNTGLHIAKNRSKWRNIVRKKLTQQENHDPQ